MILKRQQKNDVVKAIYSSSNICASTYNKPTKDLTIIFNNGGQYKYADVSEAVYMRFEIADSQGAVFNSHIKSHSFEKLDKVDVAIILNEVNTLKQAEDAEKINNSVRLVINGMSSLVNEYNASGDDKTLNSIKLDLVKQAIAEYEKVIDGKLDTVNG